MAVVISYLFIFGLISCTIGKPADNGLYGIEGLLKELAQQKGKFDIAISHHEDSPKRHHEDKAHITPHVDNTQTIDENEDNKLTANNLQSIYNLYTKPDKVPQPSEGSILIQKLSECTDGSKCKNLATQPLESHVLGYLSDDNTGDAEDKNELRCAGDRCGRDRDDDDSYITVRCIGNRCSADNDEGDNLRCAGNACGTSRDDAPCSNNQCSRNVEELLRCNENRCIRDNNDHENRDDLRCSGDRCGLNRDNTNVVRCRGKACSIARYNENNDRNDETQWQPKRVKLSENVDAVILDMDDLQNLLSVYSTHGNKLSGADSHRTKYLENLLNNKNINIDTILNDIEKRNEKYELVKQIKRLLAQNASL